MQLFGLLTAPGLSKLCLEEITQRGGDIQSAKTHRLRSHDLVLIYGDYKIYKRLQTVEDLFFIVIPPTKVVEKKDLSKLIPKNFRGAIVEALPLLPPRKSKKKATSAAIFVKQDTDHEIYRREISDTIARYLLTNFSNWRIQEPADVELWAFYSGEVVTVGLRLSEPTLKTRKYRDEERPGSLRPPIAAAMVVSSRATENDVVLDPMCGSGTLLLERGTFGPYGKLIGCDIDPLALDLAAKSAKRLHLELETRCGDTSKGETLSDLEGKVNRILCNLPFGKQYAEESELKDLYNQSFRTWIPLLAEGGFMVVLTPARQELISAAKANGLWLDQVGTIRVKGLLCGIYEAKRKI